MAAGLVTPRPPATHELIIKDYFSNKVHAKDPSTVLVTQTDTLSKLNRIIEGYQL